MCKIILHILSIDRLQILHYYIIILLEFILYIKNIIVELNRRHFHPQNFYSY